MARLWFADFAIMDGKGATGHLGFYFTAPEVDNGIDDLAEYLNEVATRLDAGIKGAITGIRLSRPIAITADVKSTPNVNADVEEGAKFTWITENNTSVKMRVPTWDEVFPPGTTENDDFVDIIAFAIETPTEWLMSLANARAEEVDAAHVTPRYKENFKRRKG